MAEAQAVAIDPADPDNARVLEEARRRNEELQREQKDRDRALRQPHEPAEAKGVYTFADLDVPLKEHRENGENWHWSEPGRHQVAAATLDKARAVHLDEVTPAEDPDNVAARRDRAEAGQQS